MTETEVSTLFKRCCRCKAVLPLSAFCKDRGKPDGLQVRCKACHREAVYATRARKGRAESELAVLRRRAAVTKYYRAHIAERKAYHKSLRADLTDAYVAESLGLRLSDAPPALIAAQRVRLQIKRQLRRELR